MVVAPGGTTECLEIAAMADSFDFAYASHALEYALKHAR